MDDFTLPQNIYENILSLMKDLTFEDYDVRFSKGSNKGDNYLGIITKANVIARKNGITTTMNLVVKNASEVEEYRQYTKIELLFRREVYMYENVFPELLEFQNELNMEPYYPFVQLFKSSLDAPYEFLIMEDMNYHGYKMNNRKSPTDFNHCSLVMKSLGRYHALSLSLQHLKPDVFRKLAKGTREIYYENVSLEILSNMTIKSCCERIIKNLIEDDESDLILKVRKFARFPLEGLLENLSAEAAGKHAVLCHGDCWTNNFLFKYKDEDLSNPTDICFLDWQMSRCASPALDISYFMFVSTEKELRQQHYHNLLDIYHSSLTDTLKQFGCDPALFTKEVLLDHMKRFSKYGLMMTFIVVPLIVADNDDLPNWTEEMTEDDRRKMFTEEGKHEQLSMNRLVDIVRDFDKHKRKLPRQQQMNSYNARNWPFHLNRMSRHLKRDSATMK